MKQKKSLKIIIKTKSKKVQKKILKKYQTKIIKIIKIIKSIILSKKERIMCKLIHAPDVKRKYLSKHHP